MRQSIIHVALVVRDYDEMRAAGIRFIREPKEAVYGTVAVFEDLYGNRWDLVQPLATYDRNNSQVDLPGPAW